LVCCLILTILTQLRPTNGLVILFGVKVTFLVLLVLLDILAFYDLIKEIFTEKEAIRLLRIVD
jgi:hypothetical protein